MARAILETDSVDLIAQCLNSGVLGTTELNPIVCKEGLLGKSVVLEMELKVSSRQAYTHNLELFPKP